MLTNEQRAHDIAIVLIQNALNNPANYATDEELQSGRVEFDLVGKYLSFYEGILNELNKSIK